jgi:hypothetical protein
LNLAPTIASFHAWPIKHHKIRLDGSVVADAEETADVVVLGCQGIQIAQFLVPTSPLALAHDSKIMLGVLVEVLRFDRVAGSRRIAREH